jgi:hypothetical protein
MNIENLIAGMLGFSVGFHLLMLGATADGGPLAAISILGAGAIMAAALHVLTLAIAGDWR